MPEELTDDWSELWINAGMIPPSLITTNTLYHGTISTGTAGEPNVQHVDPASNATFRETLNLLNTWPNLLPYTQGSADFYNSAPRRPFLTITLPFSTMSQIDKELIFDIIKLAREGQDICNQYMIFLKTTILHEQGRSSPSQTR